MQLVAHLQIHGRMFGRMFESQLGHVTLVEIDHEIIAKVILPLHGLNKNIKL